MSGIIAQNPAPQGTEPHSLTEPCGHRHIATRLFRGRRLMTVLVAIVSLLLAVCMALFTLRTIHQDISETVGGLKRQANVLASNLAATTAETLINRDYTGIEQQLLRVIQFPGIDEIQIADATGRVLSDVVLTGGKGQAKYGRAVLQPPAELRVHMDVGHGRMVVWRPIFLGDLLGWVRITESLGSVAATTDRIWTTNAEFGALLLLSTVLSMMLILRRPMRSLEGYADFADRLGERSGEQTTVCTTSQEMERLGEALNRASSRLHDQDLAIQRGMEDLERLAAFPEMSPDIVLSLTFDGEQQYINPYGRELLATLGLTDRDIAALLPPDHRDVLARCRQERGAARQIESRYGNRTFLWAFSPIANSGLVHCYGSEITAHRLAEEQAKEALIAKGVAEAATQAKSMFLANMSHEIRTPLTAIIGFSEALLDADRDAGERIELSQTIRRAGKHLLNIINDVLDLSKIEAGHLDMQRETVPLFELIEDVATLARQQAEFKAIAFTVEPVLPLPLTIYSDPVRVRQILLNLVGNAIKFTERGRVTLRLRYDARNCILSMAVHDTGIGIPKEQISRLFSAFTQADDGTTRRFGGTGLGLALSRQLAEKLGGTITADSVQGEYSVFTFSLDAGEADSLIRNQEEWHHAAEPVAWSLRSMRLHGTVLLAEDNPDNQRLIALNGRSLGVTVHVVEDGQAAVAEAITRPYDVVLMDMQMPVMDGLTAVRTLRAKGYGGPIVALTANASTADVAACLKAGCDAFLAKPIERQRFGETLRQYLRSQTERAASRTRERVVASAPPGDRAVTDDAPIMSELLSEGPDMADLITYFIERLPGYLQRLEAACGAGDTAALKRLAHDLKAVGGGYGYPIITEQAEQLEAALDAEPDRVGAIVEALAYTARRIEAGAAVQDGAEARLHD